MKILQIAPRYYPSLGGVEETVRQYSEKLVNTFHHEVTVLTSNVDSDHTHFVNGVRVQRNWSIPFLSKGPFMPVTPFLPFSLLKANSDLWHLHANKRFTTDISALLQLVKKIPFVYSPYAGMFGTTPLGRLHNQTIGKLAFGADVIIAITNYEKQLLERKGVRAKRFVVIPPGVDITMFKNTSGNFLTKYNITGKKIILSVGRLTKHKGMDVLLKSFALVLKKEPDSCLVIVGPDAGAGTSLKDLASELGVSEATLFTGPISRVELMSAYKEADVFCIPSRNEAFGMVIIEAFAAGIPVVAANNSAIPEVVTDKVTGLLYETENYRELADKLTMLLCDKKLGQSLINNAASVVATTYNWDNIVGQVNQLYEEVLS